MAFKVRLRGRFYRAGFSSLFLWWLLCLQSGCLKYTESFSEQHYLPTINLWMQKLFYLHRNKWIKLDYKDVALKSKENKRHPPLFLHPIFSIMWMDKKICLGSFEVWCAWMETSKLQHYFKSAFWGEFRDITMIFIFRALLKTVLLYYRFGRKMQNCFSEDMLYKTITFPVTLRFSSSTISSLI